MANRAFNGFVIPAPIFIGINSSRNPVLFPPFLDSRSPIYTFEDKFHGNDNLGDTPKVSFQRAKVLFLS
jgi:hypothetical protein